MEGIIDTITNDPDTSLASVCKLIFLLTLLIGGDAGY
jgi:hypothetical protein